MYRDYTHQRYLIEQAIKYRGQDIKITRSSLNNYGEPDGETEMRKCRGLFRDSAGFINTLLENAASTPKQTTPRVLIQYYEGITVGDTVYAHDQKYRIDGWEDIGGMHLFADLSLEEIV